MSKLARLSLGIAVLISFLQSVEAQVNNFIGTWINDDSLTQGITSVIISSDDFGNLTVHTYGKCYLADCEWEITKETYGECQPADCDWGIVPVLSPENPLVVVYEGTNTLTINLILESFIHIHSVFDDGQAADYYMYKDENYPPTATFTASSLQGETPLTVTLDASSSTDPDGSIEEYKWNVDEQTLFGPITTVTLQLAGEHVVILTVTDDRGATATQTQTIQVMAPPNQIPTAAFTASSLQGEVPLTVTLDASSSTDPDGSIEEYKWSVDEQTLFGPITTVTLQPAGEHVVILTVMDDRGATATQTQTIQVMAPPNQIPTAAFTASSLQGETPLTVTLDASSSTDPDGSIAKYEWSANGQTLVGKSVEVTFSEPGEYLVALTVTDDRGATATHSQTIQVVAPNQVPTAAFTASSLQGETPLTVTLDASSSTDPDGVIAKYEWSVNGQTLADKIVEVTFSEPGEYLVALTVTDDRGATATHSQTIQVVAPNQVPTAAFTASSLQGETPLTVTLDASGSFDQDGSIAKYEWSVNGQTLVGKSVEVTFSEPGEYLVDLTVTDDRGATATHSQTIQIVAPNQVPTAAFTASSLQGEAPLTVTLDASSSTDSDGVIAKYEWSANGQTLVGKSVEVTFSEPGEYLVALTVTDDRGATATHSQTIQVVAPNQVPTAAFTASSLQGEIPLTVTLDASGSFDPDGSIAKYEWSENGQTLADKIVEVTFSEPGEYLVILTVTDDRGATATHSQAIQVVAPNQVPTAAFTASSLQGEAPLTVTLDASSSTDPDGSIAKYEWSVNGQTLVGKSVEVTFSEPGEYLVILTVTDDRGATATHSQAIQVVAPNQVPTAAFTASSLQGETPLTVTLDASSSTDPDGVIAKYEWSVNGQTLADKIVEVTFSEPGEYLVALTVTDDRGATATHSQTIQVVAPNQVPTAAFTASSLQGETPLTVTLDASSSTDPDGVIAKYEWSVNGQTLADKIVEVTFSEPGEYLVALTVTDDRGATATHSQTIQVVAPNQVPTAAFTASPLPEEWDAPLTVTLDASSSTDPDGSIAKYEWSADGQMLVDKIVEVTFSEPGEHLVVLTVTDDKGASASKNYTITVSQPIPRIGLEPTTLGFDNTQATTMRSIDDLSIRLRKDPGNELLFAEETATPTIENNTSESIVLRARTVAANLSALSTGMAYAEQVVLNLFPEVSFTVMNTSINYRTDDDYSWIGKIVGMQFGDVILVIKDGKITGSVNAQGDFYTIKPSANGTQVIQQVNPAVLPENNAAALHREAPFSQTSQQESRSHQSGLRAIGGSPLIIDVMVVYTQTVAQAAKGNISSEIQEAIDRANQAYANSNIQQRLRLVHTEEVKYTEVGINDLLRLQDGKDGFMDNVLALRDRYKADLVSLWVEEKQPAYCGIGYTLSSRSLSQAFAAYGFNVVERPCEVNGGYTFVHELGHNMGAHHELDAYSGSSYAGCSGKGAYSYSCAYVYNAGTQQKSWRTIMAYGSRCTKSGYTCPRVGYFSNPDITYQGVLTGESSANNALTLNNTAALVASFREASELLTEETKEFTISNRGKADLIVSDISLQNNLSGVTISPTTAIIPPKASVVVTVKVNYSQVPVGKTTHRLLVSSNDPKKSSAVVKLTINHQLDPSASLAPGDFYDTNSETLSITTTALGNIYQATLSSVELQPTIIGSTFALNELVIPVTGLIAEELTSYDPQTGMIQIPVMITHLPSGEPMLFEAQMQETSPGLFEIKQFEVIPVEVTE